MTAQSEHYLLCTCDDEIPQRLSHQARYQRRLDMAVNVAAGLTVRQVAAMFEVTPQTVRHACEEHGVELVLDWKAAGPEGGAE